MSKRCWITDKIHLLDVHLPNIFMGIGSVVEVPIISMVARRLSYSEETIANFVVLASVSRVLSDIPSGVLAECVGVERLMASSILVYILGCAVGLSVSPSALVLGIFSVTCGFTSGVFFLSRHIYVANIFARKYRGTVMAFLSGLMRSSHVIGPAALAVVATRWPEAQCYFVIPFASAILALASIWLNSAVEKCEGKGSVDDTDSCFDGESVCFVVAAPGETYESTKDCVSGEKDLSPSTMELQFRDEDEACENFHISILWTTIVDQWLTIWRLGLYIILYISLRSNRKLLLTFAAMRLNFEDSALAYLLTLSFAFDACLFPLGGIMMDLLGRRYSLLPVTLGLGIVYTLLPLFETERWLYVMSALFGVADALGCGIIMTLIADHAPAKFGGPFFGVMRMVQDMGHVLAAAAVSIVTHHTSFVTCCYIWGALSVVTAVWVLKGIPVHEPCKGI